MSKDTPIRAFLSILHYPDTSQLDIMDFPCIAIVYKGSQSPELVLRTEAVYSQCVRGKIPRGVEFIVA